MVNSRRIFGFAGYSGAGKTTLIEQLLPRFVAAGLKVSLVKHAHHAFDIDKPGKDSYRHREAGASQVLVTSETRWVLMHESRDEPEPTLEAQIARFSPCDLVLVEGFKRAAIPKLEIHRPSHGRPPLFIDDANIVAVKDRNFNGTFGVSGPFLSVSIVKLVFKVPDRRVKPAPEFPLSVPVATWAAEVCRSGGHRHD